MNRSPKLVLRLSLFSTTVACAGLLLAAPRAARAQATVSAEPGLSQLYRSEHWVPVRITLTNQGQPAKVEVRAHFFPMGEGVQEYRIPERELSGGANEVHTLYVRSPRSYGPQPLTVDLYKDGRIINTVKPQLRLAPEENWLLYAIGPAESTTPLNILTTAQMPPRTLPQGMPPGVRAKTAPPLVAISEAATAPDRWQGFEAADAVVLSGVSERDFRPEQLQALKEYVTAGGTLVITGGLNWNRLTTPFFRDILPVKVSGSSTLARLPQETPGGAPPGGPLPVVTSSLKSGAGSTLASRGLPLIATGERGSGQVVFLAFDPTLAPLRDRPETAGLWAAVMKRQDPTLIQEVTQAEDRGDYYGGIAPPAYYRDGPPRLADAPFAIPQLDIPAFYVVALFLLAYVIILVPVNYFFLKARDKKEYAWLTTPGIVLLFSVGAYLIGYGFKGGSTLAVKVGLIEAHSGQDAAPFVLYTGVFSPRKAGYEIHFAAANPQQDAFSNALFAEPETSRSQAGLRISQDDQTRIEDFAVDMWAMRVLKAEGVANLGGGFKAELKNGTSGVSGKLANNTPYPLENCALISGDTVTPVGDVGPGGVATIPSMPLGARSGSFLPSRLADTVKGETKQARMRRSVLQTLADSAPRRTPPTARANAEVQLVGWISQPIGKLAIDGRSPREISETLVVVHLDR